MTTNNLINEHFKPINEDMRFEALQTLRETQSNLVAISFLPVISIMRENNPYRQDVLKFQDDLDALTMNIQNFISKAKNDVDYVPEEPDEEPADDTKDIKPEDTADNNDTKENPEDSSESKIDK